MILAVDIGNTNIVIGALDEEKIVFIERLSTNTKKTELEYAMDIKSILGLHKIEEDSIDGGIIASVVPTLTDILSKSIKKLLNIDSLIVGPGIKTGVNIRLDNPAEIGADMVACAVCAVTEYKAPALIIDLGTANTVSVIDENKNILGGLIMPGIGVSLEALTESAAQLIDISMDIPKDIIGKNTKECMKSGIIYGNAAMIDGVIDRIAEKMGHDLTLIATGGLSKLIIPFCKHKITMDENLLHKGLGYIYRKNINDNRLTK